MTTGVDRQTRRPVVPLSAASPEHGTIGRFREVLGAQPDAVAVTDSERELTFAQVAAEAAGILHALQAVAGPAPERSGVATGEPGSGRSRSPGCTVTTSVRSARYWLL